MDRKKTHFLRLALLTSLFIHLTIFSTFTFVFPLMQHSFKPKMTFLGGILSAYDIRTLSRPEEKQSYLSEQKRSNIDVLSIQEIHQPKTEKSTKIEANSQTGKIDLKSSFEDPIRSIDDAKKSLDHIGINLDLTPYKSLNLNE